MTDHKTRVPVEREALQKATSNQEASERLCRDDVKAGCLDSELKRLLHARIDEALAGKLSGKTIFEIIEEEFSSLS